MFYRYVLFCFFGKTIEKTTTITSLSKDYFETQKSNFLNTYKLEKDFNENIDKCFYNKTKLSIILTDEKNELEKKWKTKILFETSPRGNIIMYYDAFKQGFAYYCDQTSIPYNLLNAVAMKYVRIYRCRDFFVDNLETPEENPSPLLDIQEKKESKKEKPEGKTENKGKKSPFARFKNYNTVSNKLKDEKKEGKKEETEKKEDKIYIRNKFICLGKICNFYILQCDPTNKKGKRLAPFKSNLIDSMKNSQMQTPMVSYSDYKKLKQPTTI
jgi:putative component of membrane protein insertase Oxa1/YidC/SpoIIIJ protein YidD